MDLPFRYLRFYFVDGLHFWLRLWRNSIATIEEDLAVTLMIRLLFVPLFHDSSFMGRVLSLVFRLGRISIGFFAYFIVTLLILILALIWFLGPLFILTYGLKWLTPLILGLSLILFVYRLLSSPVKKITEITDATQLKQTTKVKLSTLTWSKLLAQKSVKDLLMRLELPEVEFVNLNLPLDSALEAKTYELAKILKVDHPTASHFFVASLLLFPELENLLLKYRLSSDDLLWALHFQQAQHDYYEPVFMWSENYRVRHLKGLNRGWLAAPTPALDSVSVDLTAQAGYDSVQEYVGRAEQVKQVVQTLSSSHGSNVLIVGEAGTGRSSLAKFLAKTIVQGDAPSTLATKRLVQLDLSKLIAGVQNQGDLASRVKNFFNEVIYFQNIIVFVDEIENLGIGEMAASYNLYALMEPYLESGHVQFLATTDPSSYDKIIERHSSFTRLFTKIDLPPATADETTQYLLDQAIVAEGRSHLKFTLIALRAMAQLSSKYIHDHVLPDSAISLFLDCIEQNQTGVVSSSLVKQILETETHLPLVDVSDEDRSRILNLEADIKQSLFGQDDAITAITNSLKRTAAHLGDQNRPVGSFLFVGPTGVGKTELARLLADKYFQDQGAFLRFDMSEYQTQSSIERLIGNADQPGELTEAISHHPATLLLLDEFEKADPKVLTLFLQVLEDGRLTDFNGKTTDFRDTIIVATSNAVSLTIAQGLQHGQSIEQLKQVVRNELLQIFKPELINRFDEVVIFKPLGPDQLTQIVHRQLNQLQQKLHQEGYEVDFAPDLISWLAAHGYDPVLGARPLRRLIQDTLEANLSTMILEHKIQPGEKLTLTAEMFQSKV